MNTKSQIKTVRVPHGPTFEVSRSTLDILSEVETLETFPNGHQIKLVTVSQMVDNKLKNVEIQALFYPKSMRRLPERILKKEDTFNKPQAISATHDTVKRSRRQETRSYYGASSAYTTANATY